MMDQPSERSRLIAAIYAVAHDPARLLLLRPSLALLADKGVLHDPSADLAFHFEQADRLLAESGAAGAGATQHAAPKDIILDGRLVLQVPSAALSNVRPGDFLPDETWQADRGGKDRDIVKAVSAGLQEQAIISLSLDGDEQRPILHLVFRTPGRSETVTLRPIPLRWDRDSAARFADDFALTGAEQAILREVLERGSLRLLAEERGTSLGTVRNQLKRLLAKLSLGSQGELIALYGGYREVHKLRPEGLPKEVQGSSQGSFLLGGIDVRVEFYGPATGRPVLYFHPLFGGPFLPEETVEAFVAAGLRIIAPWRPYCGRTAEEGSGVPMAREFARRCAQLLDILGVERVTALAASGGTAFALAFAQNHSELCRKVVIAGPAIPIATDADLAQLGLGHRLPLQLARRLPAAMRLYVRAVVAKIRKGLDANYLDTFFRDAPADHAFAARPAIREFLRTAMLEIFQHGFRAATEELELYAIDWSELAESIEVPVTILRGVDDKLANRDLADSFAARHGFRVLKSIPDSGSFLVFQDTGRVVSQLDGDLAE
ncbi:alpha/beta fold hydrolase [Qipengyuania sp. 1NDH17]|uniref:Alpha/beta fold hydrolase n=1 Tax=Qipengyuania polymorpha TaxID=2867234 RepID=A0ABS7IXG9_9SPHN|nr:alpha/beta fold hydrolase [Qipengyuania polymorpha]MBX7458251.1 alpha/beta fold hydrolase [Qipengyuania polymorpha]